MFIDILIKKKTEVSIVSSELFSLAIYCFYQCKKDNQFNICSKLMFPTLKH